MTEWHNIPQPLLQQQDTSPLEQWLTNRGLTMTLLELDAERRRRGITGRRF